MSEAQPELRLSRVGKRPVAIPKGVSVDIKGRDVKVKGPRGELERTFHIDVLIEKQGEELKVLPNGHPKRFAQ